MARLSPQINQPGRTHCQKVGHCFCSHGVKIPELAVPLSTSRACLGPPQDSQSLPPRHHVGKLKIKAFGFRYRANSSLGSFDSCRLHASHSWPTFSYKMGAAHLSGFLGLECRKQIASAFEKEKYLCSDMILHKLLYRCQYTWPLSFIFLNAFTPINWTTYYVLDTRESVASEQDKIGPWPYGGYSVFGETDTKQILLS